MAPLAVLVIFFDSKPVFDVTRASVAHLVDVHHQGVAAAEVNLRVAGVRAMNSAAELGVLTPEFIMAIGGMALMIGGVFAGDQWQQLLNWCAIALLLAALAVLLALRPRATAFNGSFIADAFAEFVKVLVLAGAALVLFMGQSYIERQHLARVLNSLCSWCFRRSA